MTATAELSLLPVEGPDAVRRIRGGMFNDSISCFFSAMSGSMPMTTFAQVGTGATAAAALTSTTEPAAQMPSCTVQGVVRHKQTAHSHCGR